MENFEPPKRPPSWRYTVCAVPGCERGPRAFSRFCSNHARTAYRTRDPNGRVLRRGELKPYAELSDLYLSRHAEHPAVVAALDYMAGLLVSQAFAGPIRQQFERLRICGADRREMLVAVLSVWGVMFHHPHSCGTDASQTFNLGRRLLTVRPLAKTRATRSGKLYSAHLSARLCAAVGQELRDSTGIFAKTFWDFIDAELEAPALAKKALRDALEIPFTAEAGQPIPAENSEP